MTQMASVDLAEIGLRIAEHLLMSFSATAVASTVAILVSIYVWDRPQMARWISGLCGTLQTIPSLALFAALLPFLGIGFWPAVTALTLYAILPVLRNCLTGFQDCPRELVDVARSFGATRWDQMVWLQIPQGLPMIVAGVRTAMVWTVGAATLAAFIGAGGLGEFINRGLSLNDPGLLLLGAVPSAALAMSLDAGMARVEGWAHQYKNGERGSDR